MKTKKAFAPPSSCFYYHHFIISCTEWNHFSLALPVVHHQVANLCSKFGVLVLFYLDLSCIDRTLHTYVGTYICILRATRLGVVPYIHMTIYA